MTIFEAIEEGNLNELRNALNREGANVNMKFDRSLDEHQNSPLHIAVEEGNIPIIRELLNRGANVDAQNNLQNTPLHNAIIENPNIEVIQELLNRQPNIEATNQHNETPLHLAAGAGVDPGSLEITQLLLENGANIHAVGGEYPLTPLEHALAINVYHQEDINVELVQALINGGADVLRLSNEGSTLLHLAVENLAARDALQMLIDAGANVNAINQNQETPLHIAAQSRETNALDTIRLLVRNNANASALDNQNRTPLSLMVLNPVESVVNYAEDLVMMQNIAPQNRGQLEQGQNQQQLGAIIIPMNENEVAPDNGNQARRNAPEQGQQNDQNQQELGAMIIPMNENEVAPNNGNQARRRNAPEQEQQNEQNERRVRPRRQ